MKIYPYMYRWFHINTNCDARPGVYCGMKKRPSGNTALTTMRPRELELRILKNEGMLFKRHKSIILPNKHSIQFYFEQRRHS